MVSYFRNCSAITSNIKLSEMYRQVGEIEIMDKKVRFFPFQVPICTCDHSQIVHADSLENFHGECNVEGCKCKKFTWTAKFKIFNHRVRDEEVIFLGNELLECMERNRK